VRSYYKYCRKIKRLIGQGKLEDAFLWAFATTYMAKEESFWFEDTGVGIPTFQRKLKKSSKILTTFWRKILRHRIEELGITACDCACIIYLLSEFKDELEGIEYEQVPEFPD
jgi:hypothetical protein